jgi:hypothetical protein
MAHWATDQAGRQLSRFTPKQWRKPRPVVASNIGHEVAKAPGVDYPVAELESEEQEGRRARARGVMEMNKYHVVASLFVTTTTIVGVGPSSAATSRDLAGRWCTEQLGSMALIFRPASMRVDALGYANGRGDQRLPVHKVFPVKYTSDGGVVGVHYVDRGRPVFKRFSVWEGVLRQISGTPGAVTFNRC